MTDNEYDVIDELYFVQPYQYLKDNLSMTDEVLIATLQGLIDKGWVKCFEGIDSEEVVDNPSLTSHYKKYRYLATKAGLLRHTSGE